METYMPCFDYLCLTRINLNWKRCKGKLQILKKKFNINKQNNFRKAKLIIKIMSNTRKKNPKQKNHPTKETTTDTNQP